MKVLNQLLVPLSFLGLGIILNSTATAFSASYNGAEQDNAKATSQSKIINNGGIY
jgi:hypothetical protein